jgi:hypothetical protein
MFLPAQKRKKTRLSVPSLTEICFQILLLGVEKSFIPRLLLF